MLLCGRPTEKIVHLLATIEGGGPKIEKSKNIILVITERRK